MKDQKERQNFIDDMLPVDSAGKLIYSLTVSTFFFIYILLFIYFNIVLYFISA